MLLDDRLFEDFKRLFGFLQAIDENTNGRYSGSLNPILYSLQDISNKLTFEMELKRKLQSYKMQGFEVDDYLNKPYYNYDTMRGELSQILENCKNLQIMLVKFNSAALTAPDNLKREFLALAKKPGRYLEAVSIFNKIFSQR